MNELIYLGLGSNQGNREALLQSAVRKLEGPHLRLSRISRLYETEPIGLREQAWFLNLVAEFYTDLSPELLLDRIQEVEQELGRERTIVNGPRTLDIDLLLYDNAVIRRNNLIVPHPRYKDRRFVLEPLAELNPTLRDPVSNLSVAEMLKALTGQLVRLHENGDEANER